KTCAERGRSIENSKSKIRFSISRKPMNKEILAILVATLTLGSFHSALAQQEGKVWRIGIFHVGLDHVPPSFEPLRQQLKTLGYEEGKNLLVDWRNLPDEEAAAPRSCSSSGTVWI